MTLVVRVHGGAPPNGRNSMGLLRGVCGGASSIGLNSMNLEVRVHGDASMTRRNSTRVTWWYLKART